ncbi:MAG: nucleotidyltransferase domain-containing protein [Balneolaceae bacterium]
MNREEILAYLSKKKPEFEEKYGVKKIGLFGSYAEGKNNEQSDIDIVVELIQPDLLILIGIKQHIQEKLGKKVDIVRYRDRMNHTLKKRIDKDALYV